MRDRLAFYVEVLAIPDLTMRSEPGTGAEYIGSIPYGAAVPVYGRIAPEVAETDRNAWLKVRYDGQIGFVRAGCVKLD
jgi:uncharacterized protein YraI